MKVSDPIIFGHAVRAFVGDDVFAGTRRRQPQRRPGQPARRRTPRPRTAVDARARRRARPLHGRLRPRHHEPARPERRDRRRLDAGADPRVRARAGTPPAPSRTPSASSPTPATPRCTPRRSTHCKEHGAFDPATMGTTPNVGLMAQKAEEYGSHDKTFEIAAPGIGARGRRRAAPRCWSTTSTPGDIWRMCQTKDAPIQDWVGLAVGRARATGAPAVFWLDETRPHDAQLLEKVRPALDAARHRRPADRDPAGRRGRALHAGARPPRRGHDLGHRQRPARLPHRPVPDPRAGHQREDALDRPAHERRRTVRDRRRRLGAQARPAVPEGEPPALGLARRVPRAGGLAGDARREDRQRARPAAGRHARPRDRQRAGGRAARRRARSASSTTAAATSTSRSTGRRSSRRRPRTPSWPRASRRWRSGWPTTRRRSSPSSTASRARRWTSAATTGPIRPRAEAAMRPSATLNEALATLA